MLCGVANNCFNSDMPNTNWKQHISYLKTGSIWLLEYTVLQHYYINHLSVLEEFKCVTRYKWLEIYVIL
jgi:hypothetical protein